MRGILNTRDTHVQEPYIFQDKEIINKPLTKRSSRSFHHIVIPISISMSENLCNLNVV